MVRTSSLRTELHGAPKNHYAGIQLKSEGIIDTSFDLKSILSSLKQKFPTLKQCPKACRIQVAQVLKLAIDKCITENTIDAWHLLLTFPYIVLQCTPKSHTEIGQSLNSKIKNNLTIFESLNNNTYQDFLLSMSSKAFYKNKNETKVNTNIGPKVISKMSEGNIRGAIRLLTSDDTIAPNSSDTLDILLEKHPNH